MSKMTQRDFMILALYAKGHRELPYIGKTLVYSYGDGRKIFLGPAGSIRLGRIKSESIPMPDGFKAELLAKGAAIYDKRKES